MKKTSGYDPRAALQMAQMSAITYAQYQQNEGDVTKLQLPEDITRALQGYEQVATLYAPEIDITNDAHVHTVTALRQSLAEQHETHPANLEATHHQSLLDNIKSRFDVKQALFGFALKPTGDSDNALGNVIAIRGTVSPFEWVLDALALQVQYDPLDASQGRVHAGFAALNAVLLAELMTTLEIKFRFWDDASDTYVTGHSLGAAVATLIAMDITHVRSGLSGGLKMYNFASPRVGNPAFQSAYNAAVPNSFRLANFSDVVPMMPPGSVTIPGETDPLSYTHIGEAWTYLNDTGEVTGNHSLSDNYIPAVSAQVPSSIQPTFPVRVTD